MRAVCPACGTGYDISKTGKYQCGVCGEKFFVHESSAAENLNGSVPPPPESVDSGAKTEQRRKKITVKKDILLKLIVLVIAFTLLGGIWCYKNGSKPSSREEQKHLEAEQELPAKEQEKAEAQKAEQRRLEEERKKAEQRRLAEEREKAEQRRLAEEQKAGYLNQIAQDEERGFKFSKDKRTLLKAPENIIDYTIPHGVTRIGEEAFLRCKLTSVTIPNSVTSIGDGAFFLCSALKSVTIPNSVTGLGNGAFQSCSKLTSITIPDSVTRIGQGAFADCAKLTSITIPDTVTYIGKYAFALCSRLTSVTLPSNLTTIEEGTFFQCWKLTSVTIPKRVTVIEKFAFYLCRELPSVTLPDRLTVIGDYAFSSCLDLKSVTIPANVVSIGFEAFENSGCSKQVEQNYPDRIRARLSSQTSPTSQKKSPPGKKNKKQKKQAKPKHTPTFEENLTPEQIDRKIAVFRSRIVNASTEKIPSAYKERLLEAFDDLAKTQIGRYIFEKAHPDISFGGVKNIPAGASYDLNSKHIVLCDLLFSDLPLKLPESLAHELFHSVQDINGMIGAPEKSLAEKVTIHKLMEFSTELVEIFVQDQMEKLPKYRYLAIDDRVILFRELRDAKRAEGADEETAERFARTKVFETYWSGRFETPIRVGNKNILPRTEAMRDIGNWNSAYNVNAANILVGERRSSYEAMRDKGITPHIQKYSQLMGIDTRPSFFRDPQTTSFSIPNSTTMFTYLGGIKVGEMQILVGTGKMIKQYGRKGQMLIFYPQVNEKKGADGNRSYTEYHEGTRIKRATYTYKNGKMNGVYREYDQQGKQILEVPIKNNVANGNGLIL